MFTPEKIMKLSQYESRILDLIELQIRDDDDSLTQSDLQGAIEAILLEVCSDKDL